MRTVPCTWRVTASDGSWARPTWLLLAAAVLAVFFPGAAQAAKTLDIYFIDVEGGQATLVVSPSGQSLLIDTGFPVRVHEHFSEP